MYITSSSVEYIRNRKDKIILETKNIKTEQNTPKTITYKPNKVIKTKTNTPNYNPYDISEISNASYKAIWNMLDGSNFQTDSMVNLLMKAEEEHRISAVFLIAVMRWESGHGYSDLALSHFNNFSIRTSHGWKYFNSFEECTTYSIDLFVNYYLNPNHTLYNGTSVWNVGINYCTSSDTWGDEINSLAYEMINKTQRGLM